MTIAPVPGRCEISRACAGDEDVKSRSDRVGFTPAPTIPLRSVLGRVGEELERLGHLLDQFEIAIAPCLPEVVGQAPGLVREIQSLDEIGQSLNGLVGFLAALVPDTASQWHLDPGPAAGVVKLADLAARLGFRDEAAPSAAVDPGDFELF